MTVEELIKELQTLENQKAEVKVKTEYGLRSVAGTAEVFHYGDWFTTFECYRLTVGD